jgi:predicted RNase H-like nuclease
MSVTAVGIDACKKGWIVVALDPDRPTAHFIPSISALVDAVPDVTTIAIDIPIGLPDVGQRVADQLAYDLLGPRRKSVFFVPVRGALETDDFDLANRISRESSNNGVSKQAHSLRKKILEVDKWLKSAPCQVKEIHPEVSFFAMLGGPLEYSKRTWAGMNLRRAALRDEGIDLDRLVDFTGESASVDDVLDAAAAAWSAQRIERGTQGCLPDPPEIGPRGELQAIWF